MAAPSLHKNRLLPLLHLLAKYDHLPAKGKQILVSGFMYDLFLRKPQKVILTNQEKDIYQTINILCYPPAQRMNRKIG